MKRWTAKQLDGLLKRTGMVQGERVHIDTSDRPFGGLPDVVLDVPVPPSVNKSRKIDRRHQGAVDDWKIRTDARLMASGQFRFAKNNPVGDTFELTIVLDETKCRLDLDNPTKAAVDYLKRIELIRDDDKRYMRALHITWGHAPEGCRMILRPAVPA